MRNFIIIIIRISQNTKSINPSLFSILLNNYVSPKLRIASNNSITDGYHLIYRKSDINLD